MVVACVAPIFLLIGGVSTGTFVGFKSYLLDIAPDSRRPTYVGITNTVLGVGALYPVFGGVLADLIALPGVFALSAATVGLGTWLSLHLSLPDGHET
jgi:MFS family permease